MFENIIGNEKIKKELTVIAQNNKYPNSMLFIGRSGIGKKFFAKEFAKNILCNSGKQYCGVCKSCIEFDSSNHPDFIEISPNENSVKIEQIREMQKKVAEPPIISNRKVYLIDDADTMTKEAQNALLKTLEEPPEFVNIILIGENEANFLSTIKSRCLIINFKNLTQKEINHYFVNYLNITDIPNSIIEASSGSIGKAIQFYEKMDIFESVKHVFEEFENLGLIDTLKASEIIYKYQDDKYDILDYINLILFEKAKENTNYLKCMEIVEDTKKRLRANSNFNMSIDNMLITIWEELH